MSWPMTILTTALAADTAIVGKQNFELVGPEPITREKILAFQDTVANLPEEHRLPIDAMPLEHFFCNGMYARQLTIPRDTVVVGKIHKYSQINILAKGTIAVASEHGGVRELSAPYVCVSPAGTKRAVYALTECTWITISRTDEVDLIEVERDIIAESFEHYDMFKKLPQGERA